MQTRDYVMFSDRADHQRNGARRRGGQEDGGGSPKPPRPLAAHCNGQESLATPCNQSQSEVAQTPPLIPRFRQNPVPSTGDPREPPAMSGNPAQHRPTTACWLNES